MPINPECPAPIQVYVPDDVDAVMCIPVIIPEDTVDYPSVYIASFPVKQSQLDAGVSPEYVDLNGDPYTSQPVVGVPDDLEGAGGIGNNPYWIPGEDPPSLIIGTINFWLNMW